jgi:hypothetical protein
VSKAVTAVVRRRYRNTPACPRRASCYERYAVKDPARSLRGQARHLQLVGAASQAGSRFFWHLDIAGD